jgi:hypothetical protein
MNVLPGGGGGGTYLASRGKGQSPTVLRLLPRLPFFCRRLCKDENKNFFARSLVYFWLKTSFSYTVNIFVTDVSRVFLSVMLMYFFLVFFSFMLLKNSFSCKTSQRQKNFTLFIEKAKYFV